MAEKVNAHQRGDLVQMQSLPLEAKILLTKERIRAWYDAWVRFEIENVKTGKVRYVTYDCREQGAEPPLKADEYIKSAYDGQVYLAFSGGKDSTVLKHIIESMYDDVPCVFVDTGLEYPEIRKFAMSQPNVTTLRPAMRFDDVIKTYGYPVISKSVSKTIHYARIAKREGKDNIYTQQLNGTALDRNGMLSWFNKKKWAFLVDTDFEMHNACCDVMKKKPMHDYEAKTGRITITATLADESLNRMSNWVKNGCNAFNGNKPRSAPLAFWTEQDILHYIVKYNVQYCKEVYGDIVAEYGGSSLPGQINILNVTGDITPTDKLHTTGAKRTGCIFCMYGCHLEKAPNRFQMLKETHPNQYRYCIGGGEYVNGKWQPNKQGLGLAHVLDTIGVKYD